MTNKTSAMMYVFTCRLLEHLAFGYRCDNVQAI